MRTKIDNEGRVLIPAYIRKQLSLQKGGYVLHEVSGNLLIIKKEDTVCVICGKQKKRVSTVNNRTICISCKNNLEGGAINQEF
jgi:AbrB family looped-hinge helix DNA binding protein